jgi:hypothetical protein
VCQGAYQHQIRVKHALILTANQKSAFEAVLPARFPGLGITTIEQLCTFIRQQQGGPSTEFIEQLNEALINAGVTNPAPITECMLRSVGYAQHMIIR